jgi:hypothetical protein
MGERRGAQRFLVGNSEGRDDLQYLGLDGRILLKWVSRWDGSMHGIGLGQDRDRWRAVVNVVMNIMFKNPVLYKSRM